MRNLAGAGLVLCAMSIASCQTTANATPPSRPETLICNATPGDIDYMLDTSMPRAGFEADPLDGYRSYRRDATRAVDALSLNLRDLRVTFQTYHTSEGIRLVAIPEFVDSSRVRPVEDPEIIGVFQNMLDRVATVFPCS